MRKDNILNIIITTVIAALVIAADRITKAIVDSHIAVGHSVEFIKGFMRWTHIRNEGAMMGMLSNHRWVFMVLSIVLLAGLLAFIAFSKEKLSKVLVIILACIIGGGIGNMIDRFAYGNVIDFIDVYFFPFWIWIYNVADIFVTCGAVALLAYLLIDEIKRRKGKKNDSPDLSK